MNYKSIIKSRETRLKILQMLSWVPDEWMLKLQYRIKMGRNLNLNNPERFTEKLQWYKLNYKNPNMVRCVDKYDVREYVVEKGLADILTKCYGVFDKFEDIDFNVLPNAFVMKDTLGGGGNDIIICKNKAELNLLETKKICDKWVNKKLVPDAGREWPYYSGKNHRIIIEEYLDVPSGLDDYKFFGFNGVVEYLYYITDRDFGKDIALGIFTRDFKQIDVRDVDERMLDRVIPKPENFERMLDIASYLSKEFPHVRIDLYNTNGQIYFGEMTFFDSSGYIRFKPDCFDFEIGKQFKVLI